MEANELMIGDWLFMGHDSSIPNKVTELKFKGITEERLISFWNGSYGITNTPLDETIKPIPLTLEILEKNYGKETRVGISDKPCWGEICATWSTMLWKCENSFWLEVNTIAGGFVKKHIRYVHELQHALRLAGIKKEIVL